MSRNRIIYQGEAVFTSQITGDANGNLGTGDLVRLQRVTEISNSAEVARKNVNVFGRLAAISREIVEEPTVSFDFKYYLADGYNESGIGFTTEKAANTPVSCLSGILSNSPVARRNFYVLTAEEGSDADGLDPQSAGNVGKLGVVAIGNAYLSSYSIEASVGEIPTASVSVEASNIAFSLSSTTGIQNPALNINSIGAPQYTGRVMIPTLSEMTGLAVKVLRPGDIVMSFGTGSLQMGGAVLPGMDSENPKTSAHIQSFSLELPLSRTPQNRIGSAFAFSRELDVPIDVTLSVTANLADIDQGSLRDMICAEAESRNITIAMFKPCNNTDAGGGEIDLQFTLAGASIDSQNMSSTIGDAKTVELKFTSQIGGPTDLLKGLFISGKY